MLNIINLNYPMFITTPEEKALLRRAELYLINASDISQVNLGLCKALHDIHCINNAEEVMNLKSKIRNALDQHSYLTTYLFQDDPILNTHYRSLGFKMRCKIGLFLRLVWINKLLNYTGE
jgi:hypothetical protein